MIKSRSRVSVRSSRFVSWVLCTLFIANISFLNLSSAMEGYPEANEPFASIGDAIRGEEAEISLIHVTSDAMDGYGDFKIAVDDLSQVIQFRYYANGVERRDYPLDALRTGIVLHQDGGRNVITIKSGNFNPADGGPIDLIYLYNGAFNDFRTFKMEMVRTGKNWSMRAYVDSGLVYFTSMYFQKRTFFGKTIGIEKVIVK